MSRASCIYEGKIRHRRHHPSPHAFSYRLFMMYLDLAELPTLFDGRWFWSVERFNLATFRRRDHHRSADIPLDVAVRELIEERTGVRPAGPIRLLTHLSYWGYCFNPVSFYFCFDEAGEHARWVVAEINNTPWGEQHCYVLDAATLLDQDNQSYRFPKRFHVSPFMSMDHEYDWRLTEPGESLAMQMTNTSQGRRMFDASMELKRREISGISLARSLARYPLMTVKVIGAIYFEALRLRFKRTPFFEHPKYGKRKTETQPS